MPQTVTITSDAYDFGELDDAAKEKARDWYREHIDELDFSCEIEEFVKIGEIIGIDFNTHEVQLYGGGKRHDPNVYWSVGYCQSDYAAFEGTYDYRATAAAELREINNDDSWEPIRIANELAAVQLRNGFGLRAVFNTGTHGNMSLDVKDRRNEWRSLGDDYKVVTELIEDLARYLYQQLRDQSDYLHSAEAVDEAIECNEYKFTEEGARHAYA